MSTFFLSSYMALFTTLSDLNVFFLSDFLTFIFAGATDIVFVALFFVLETLVCIKGLKEVLPLDIPGFPASDIVTRLTFIAAMENFFLGAKSGKKVKTAKKIKWHTVETEINKNNVPVLFPP